MRVSIRWLVAGVTCILVVGVLAGFKYFQIQAAIAAGGAFPEPAETVEAVTASVSPFQETFTTIGEIVAPRSLVLRNEVEGRVIAVNVASGDRVAKGDVLVQLDVSEETARLQAARARAELTRLELDRAQRLAAQKSVSEETLDRARSGHDIARAEVRALEAAIEKKSLRAPFTAVAGIHDLDEGEYLQGNTAVMELVGVDDFSWVDFNLPANQGDVEVGSEITIVLPGGKRHTMAARVVARSASASATSRTREVRARIDGVPPLPPNAVVEVAVPLGQSEPVQLPRVALLFSDRGPYVFVLEKAPEGEGYRARQRPVEVGGKSADTVTVVAGIEAGELVATAGAFKLYPGVLTHVGQRTADAGSGGE